MNDAWIADGCAMVRRMKEQGHSGRAAELARYIERKALGITPKQANRTQHQSQRLRGCSVRGCLTLRERGGRPWCFKHAPRFDRPAA